MEAGFLVDKSYGMEEVASWQEGEPQTAWWTLGGIRRGDTPRRDIATYRCTGCGLLKSYAN
jgi:hypothetical protein